MGREWLGGNKKGIQIEYNLLIYYIYYEERTHVTISPSLNPDP